MRSQDNPVLFAEYSQNCKQFMSEVKEIELSVVYDAPMLYGSDKDPVDEIIEEIKTKALSIVPDMSTEKGRSAVRSQAYAVSRVKTALDDMGKDFVADKKKEIKTIDARRKRLRDGLDAIRDLTRKPLTEWEEEEKRKEEARKARVVVAQELGKWTDENGELAQTNVLRGKMKSLDELRGSAQSNEERDAIAEGIRNLEGKIPVAEKRDADLAELAKLRAEKEAELATESKPQSPDVQESEPDPQPKSDDQGKSRLDSGKVFGGLGGYTPMNSQKSLTTEDIQKLVIEDLVNVGGMIEWEALAIFELIKDGKIRHLAITENKG